VEWLYEITGQRSREDGTPPNLASAETGSPFSELFEKSQWRAWWVEEIQLPRSAVTVIIAEKA
jgi:hypothetical protein